MRIACCVPKATNTHSEHIIVIVLPVQQWLHERDSLQRCTYFASLFGSQVVISAWFYMCVNFVLSS